MLTGDEFEKFYADNYRKIYNYFYYVTMNHHTAEDLTSTTFLKLFRSRDRYDEKRSGKLTFVFRIARNVAADYYRTNKSYEELHDEKEGAYEFEDDSLDRMVLHEILSKLTPRERQIIYYKYYLDMKCEEIAELMGITVTNTTSLCSRTLKKAKKIYEAM